MVSKSWSRPSRQRKQRRAPRHPNPLPPLQRGGSNFSHQKGLFSIVKVPYIIPKWV